MNSVPIGLAKSDHGGLHTAACSSACGGATSTTFLGRPTRRGSSGNAGGGNAASSAPATSASLLKDQESEAKASSPDTSQSDIEPCQMRVFAQTLRKLLEPKWLRIVMPFGPSWFRLVFVSEMFFAKSGFLWAVSLCKDLRVHDFANASRQR